MQQLDFCLISPMSHMKYSILPWSGLQVWMGPDIKIICKRAAKEKLNMGRRRVAHILKMYPTGVEQIEVLGWVWECVGGVGGLCVIKFSRFPNKSNTTCGMLIAY